MAVDRGIEVHPYQWQDGSAVLYAAWAGAVLAEHRGVAGGVSLSPASIAAARRVDRLVLLSPNGSTVALALAERSTTFAAGALRPAVEDLWGAGALDVSDTVPVLVDGAFAAPTGRRPDHRRSFSELRATPWTTSR